MADDQRQPPDDQPATPDDQPATPDDQPATPKDQPATPEDGSPSPGESPAAPAGEETTVLPPVPRDDRWAGRAGVPPTRPTVPASEDYLDEESGRGWWVPALIGLVGIVLLGVLGVGLWLIIRSGDSPAPVPSATRSPTTAPTTRSVAPTTAAPTATPPAQVRVPIVVGLLLSDADEVLDAFGLAYQIQRRVDPSQPAGTVLAVTPAEGTLVAAGSQVTLVVAEAPPVTASPSPSPSPSTS